MKRYWQSHGVVLTVGWKCAGWMIAALSFALPVADAACPEQPMQFGHITADHGLSQASVLAGLQDRDGFMWFATEDGLNRYDGRSITVFKNQPGNSNSLANDTVWGLAEDDEGGLWLATFGGGLSHWDPDTERFRTLIAAEDLGSGNARALSRGADGVLWIGTVDSGLFSYDPVTDEIVSYKHDPDDPYSLSDDAVYAVLEDRKGMIWVATDGGLNQLDPSTGLLTSYLNDPNEMKSLSDNRVRALLEDSDGELWVGTRGGLNHFRSGSGDFERYRHQEDDPTSLSHDRVRAIHEDSGGRLWIGTASGLNLMDCVQGQFVRHLHDPALPASLSDSYVMSIFEDRNGVLWVGTRTAGVNRWNPATWSFGHQSSSPMRPGGLSANDVTAFSEDNAGGLWIATFGGGLNQFNRVSGEFRHFRHDPEDPGSIGNDRVMALVHDHDGGLWVGTYSDGLGWLPPGGTEFEWYRRDPLQADSLSSNTVTSLLVDRSGGLWVGTFEGGLNHLESRGVGFVTYRTTEGEEGTLSSDMVTCLAEGQDGRMWIGTDDGGLNLLDPSSGTFFTFRHDPEDRNSLASNDVFALHIDAENTLWIGTRGAGFSRLEKSDDPAEQWRFTTFTDRDGLSNDVVYGIESDQDGGLWMSTNHGISHFDPSSETFTNYTVADGLQANEFHFGSSYKSRSGEIFFGGVNGFNAFYPDRLARNTNVPPVVLTGFLKRDQPVELDTPVSRLKHIDLGYLDDVVTFEVAALDYSAPEQNRFRYMLEGFSDQWINQGTWNRMTFTNLDAGRYVLRVQGANADGIWNEDGLSLELNVKPAPWLTWWAKILYGLAALLAFAGYIRAQANKLFREQEYSRRLEIEVGDRTEQLAIRNSQLQQSNEQLRQASLTDSLTGLWNRRFFFEHVMEEVSLVLRRFGEMPIGERTELKSGLVFLMIDIDNFKGINDTHGHSTGDEVLLQFRDVLQSVCRDSDILIRWGGDEFLVVARDTSLNQAEVVAERIREGVASQTFSFSGDRTVELSCSIGFACFPFLPSLPNLCSWDDVLSLADSALYGAKNSGRNAWVGLVSTGRVPTDATFGLMRTEPERLVDQEYLQVRSSLIKDETSVGK